MKLLLLLDHNLFHQIDYFISIGCYIRNRLPRFLCNFKDFRFEHTASIRRWFEKFTNLYPILMKMSSSIRHLSKTHLIKFFAFSIQYFHQKWKINGLFKTHKQIWTLVVYKEFVILCGFRISPPAKQDIQPKSAVFEKT